MSEAVPGVIVTAVFLLFSSLTFLFLPEVWSDQSRLIQAGTAQQVQQVRTALSIQSDNLTMDLGCNTLTAPVDNTGETKTPVTEFSEVGLLMDYTNTNTSSTQVANHLEYSSDWTVASLSPDTRDPAQWNPAETATFRCQFLP